MVEHASGDSVGLLVTEFISVEGLSKGLEELDAPESTPLSVPCVFKSSGESLIKWLRLLRLPRIMARTCSISIVDVLPHAWFGGEEEPTIAICLA